MIGQYKIGTLVSLYVILNQTFSSKCNYTAMVILLPDPILEHFQQGHAHHCLPQPLHLRVTFVTGEEKQSASLQFEQVASQYLTGPKIIG